MAISSTGTRSDSDVASALNFDAIKARASQILGIPVEEITDQKLGELLGLTREHVGRLRNGKHKPLLETVSEMARVLDMSLDLLTDSPAVGQR
jgi:transcriptional regulator with XRE-family HTH domain